MAFNRFARYKLIAPERMARGEHEFRLASPLSPRCAAACEADADGDTTFENLI